MTALQDLEVRQESLRRAVDFLDGWQERSRKSSLVSTIFNLLARGKWAAAKRVLDRIKQTSDQTQWHKGYINALEGMIVALEGNGDRNTFIYQIKAEKIDELRKTFLQQSRNELHDDFDRGYLAAWADYVQTLKMAGRFK